MTLRLRFLLVPALALAAGASAQTARIYADEADIRAEQTRAEAEGRAARLRAEQLESEAAQATGEVDRTARQAASLAARIQQTEAQAAAQEAGIRLIERRRDELRAALARREQPLLRLTAALQRLSRRPPLLSVLRPGSVSDAMHLRAVLDTVMPQVRARTAALSSEIARGRTLQAQARTAAAKLRASEADLRQRRNALVSLETRQRLASRAVSGAADREAERALALAERARDLDALTADLGKAGALRAALAALPGPVMRPDQPGAVAIADPVPETPAMTGAPAFMLPVAGRLVVGFGETAPGLPRSRGVTLATRAGAQTIAPAPGRVVFAGPYQGYGQIVVIEHPGGWTSLVTGLLQLDTSVGARLVAGSPLGIAGAGRPLVTLELRRDGEPVNPLDFVRAS